MATFTKTLLSGSTNGLYITCGSSSPGTLVHTAVSGTTSLDEIWLYATNTSGVNSYLMYLEWGEPYDGMSNLGSGIAITVPPSSGQVLIIPGLLLQNSKEVRAYSPSGTSDVKIYGYVNRIAS